MSPLVHRVATLLGIACLALACGPEAESPARSEGGAAEVAEAAPRTPQRIVSLAPGPSRVLLALGRGEAIVGVDGYSAELPALADRPSLGGLFAPDLERAVALRPDLAIGVHSEQQVTFFAQLRQRGIATLEVRAHTLDEVLESFVEIGRHVAREAQAQALVARVRAELDAVAASVAGRERPGVALVVNRDPLYVVGAGSFAHALIEAAGGRNVFADLDAPYPAVSLELLAARAPDLIVDTSALGEPADYWQRFAWVERVAGLAPGEATLPSPDLARGARLLRARIHPELAEPGAADGDDG